MVWFVYYYIIQEEVTINAPSNYPDLPNMAATGPVLAVEMPEFSTFMAALSMEISTTNFITYLVFLQLYRRTQSNISIVNKKIVSIYNVITCCLFGIYHLLQKWIVQIAPVSAPAHIFCNIQDLF